MDGRKSGTHLQKGEKERTKYYQEKAKNAHVKGDFVHKFVPDLSSSISMDLNHGVNAKFHEEGVWCGEIKSENGLHSHVQQRRRTCRGGHNRS